MHPLPPLYRRTGEGTTPRDPVRSQAKEEAGEGFLFEHFPPFCFGLVDDGTCDDK